MPYEIKLGQACYKRGRGEEGEKKFEAKGG